MASDSANFGSQPSPTTDASHSSMQITVHRLNGRNYLEWSESVKLVVEGQGKLGYLTGDTPALATTNTSYLVWHSENSLVTVWLLNSTEVSIAKPHVFMKSAKEVWDSVKASYFDLNNSSQIFEL